MKRIHSLIPPLFPNTLVPKHGKILHSNHHAACCNILSSCLSTKSTIKSPSSPHPCITNKKLSFSSTSFIENETTLDETLKNGNGKQFGLGLRKALERAAILSNNTLKSNEEKIIKKMISSTREGSLSTKDIDMIVKKIQFYTTNSPPRNAHRSKTDLENAIKLLYLLMDESTENRSASAAVSKVIVPILNAGRKGTQLNHSSAVHLLERIERLVHAGYVETSFYDNTTSNATLLKTYNLVLDIISKRSPQNDNDGPIQMITNIIRRMNEAPLHWDVKPDTFSYNALLYAYSRSDDPNAARDCESLLRHMKELESKNENKAGRVKVDTISYNLVLQTYATSHEKDAPNKAETLLREMEESYSEGNMQVKPNFVSLTILLEAFSRSKDFDAAEKATNTLTLMEELYHKGDDSLKPSLTTYNVVLNAWAKSRTPGASHKAEDILNRLIDTSKSNPSNHDLVRPNTISFAICIKAYAHSDEKGSSAKTMSLLKRMLELSNNDRYDTQPDIGTFYSVFLSLANDSDRNKSLKAENLLRQMEDLGLQPDIKIYNQILRCCCTTKTNDTTMKRSVIRFATETLLQIRESHFVSPDPFTFNFFIKTCDRLTNGREKLKLIKAAFQFCRSEGQFSRPVLSILQNALNPSELKDVLQFDEKESSLNFGSLKLSDFPSEWSNRVDTSNRLTQHQKNINARNAAGKRKTRQSDRRKNLL